MTWLEILGIIFLTIVLYKLIKWLAWVLYFNLAQKFTPNLLTQGKWAVVTGATDGLGKAFASQLAEKGMNIVLISRTKSKLTDAAADIEQEFKVHTKVIEADFTEGGEEVFIHIEKELQGLEIGALVNNVGMSYPHPEFFLDLKNKDKLYRDILRCNIQTLLTMCQIVMPGMVERQKGVIINVSSTAAHIPSPLLSVYGASKIFVSKFTEDLRSEYRKHGIVVQCLIPGYVATKMSKIRKATWMAPSPKAYVQSALKTLGVADHTTGYIPHSLLLSWIHFMSAISPKLSELVITRTMENIRSRNMRRANQKVSIQ